jgi:hypothetical protein
MAALLSGSFIPMTFNTIVFILCGYIKDVDHDAALPTTFQELMKRIWSAAIVTPAMHTELEYCCMCWGTYDDLTEYPYA